MEIYKINLHLFDGEEPAAAAPAATGSAETSGVSASPTDASAEVSTAEQSPADLATEFDGLVKGKYKDLYNAKVQKAIKDRFKKYDGMDAANKQYKQMATILAQKYGTDDPTKLYELMSNDNALYEDEALEKGMSVENLKSMKRLEYENAQLKEAQSQREEEEQRQQMFNEWNAKADQVRQMYPQFDLHTELENDRFRDLFTKGVDMQTAYEVIHKDEAMMTLAQQTAAAVAQKQATNAQIRAQRPTENGTGSNPGIMTKFDVNNMSDEEMMSIRDRVRRGEKVRL